jgi:hypothetical protein
MDDQEFDEKLYSAKKTDQQSLAIAYADVVHFTGIG